MSYLIQTDLKALFEFVNKNMNYIIKFILFTIFIALLSYFLVPKKYESTASILSSDSLVSDVGGLGSLVNQFGINLNASPNPLFNPDVLKKMIKSEGTLEKILLQTVLVDDKQLTIFEHLFNKYDVNNVEHFALAKKNLKNNVINIYKELSSPIINLSVETNSSDLSYAICKIIYDETISIINERNQQKNLTKLSFYNMRIQEIEKNIRLVQEDLIRFRIENKNYLSSVQLSQIYEDKKSELDIKKSIYLDLRIKKEALEIENKNKTNSLFLIEEPTMPVLKSFPTKGTFILIILILNFPLLLWYVWRFTKLEYNS